MKPIILLLCCISLTSCQSSTQTPFLDPAAILDQNYYYGPTGYTPATDFSLAEGKEFLKAAKGSLYQLFYEVDGADTVDCVNYLAVMYDHVYQATMDVIGLDPIGATENIGLVVHKSPIVFRECYQVYNSTL